MGHLNRSRCRSACQVKVSGSYQVKVSGSFVQVKVQVCQVKVSGSY